MSLHRFAKIRNILAWDLISALQSRTSLPIEVLYGTPNCMPERRMEFVHRLACPAYIEPIWGYVITATGRLMMEPLSTTGKFGNRPWKYGIPSPGEYFRAIHDSASVILRFPTVISLRFLWEWNYFHFYEDVLGKLSLLDAIGVDPNIPIVLGKYANEVGFVQQIIRRGKFRERNWIIEENAYILADNIIYCSTQQNDIRGKYDYILSQMQPPGPFPDADDRIFLTRKTRSILNLDEVEECLRHHGFRTVDTSELSIEEQMGIFARARFVTGVHGAGLTNIIFRQGCCLDLFELQSEKLPANSFHTIADAYGYGWDHLTGPSVKGDPQHADFFVPIEQLKAKLVKILTNAAP